MAEQRQFFSQRPQPLHFSVSKRGLNNEYFAKTPKTVPTGQKL